MDGQVRYVFDDSSSNDQCDKGVMKVPPETSCMSAVRALWSCDLLGYFCQTLRALFKEVFRM